VPDAEVRTRVRLRRRNARDDCTGKKIRRCELFT
jgi:hypothetical protein